MKMTVYRKAYFSAFVSFALAGWLVVSGPTVWWHWVLFLLLCVSGLHDALRGRAVVFVFPDKQEK